MNVTLLAVIAVGLGLGLLAAGMLWRAKEREKSLAEILDLPYGEPRRARHQRHRGP